MEPYNDEYTKEEDYMMWELHEIRKKMTAENLNAEEINRRAEKFLKERNMEYLIVKDVEKLNPIKFENPAKK